MNLPTSERTHNRSMAGSALLFPALAASLLLLLLSCSELTSAQSRPLCVTQFALANQACATLPAIEVAMNQNTTAPKGSRTSDDGNDGNDDSDDGNDDDDGSDGDDDDDDDENDGNDDDGEMEHDGENNRRGQYRRRRRVHRNHQGNYHDREPRAHMDCCRWMKEVDKNCVCDALVRLPPSLVKPKHTFKLSVGSSCELIYKCGGV